MQKTKRSPKKTDHDVQRKVNGDVLQRRLLARERLGETPAERLRWLLEFKDRDLNRLHPEEREALGYDLEAFIEHSGSGVITGYDFEPIPSGLVSEIQAKVIEGFANLFQKTHIAFDGNTSNLIEIWDFPRPAQVFLKRTSPDNAKRSTIELGMSLFRRREGRDDEPRFFVDPKTAILYGILNTIRESGDLLRLCSECKSPFIPVRRQEYCSTKCSQKARDRRRNKKPEF